jgi:nucleoside-diphosphate-sugar epimerase
MPNRLAHDLDHVLAHTSGLWDELQGARLFVTGGTGFFGCWLLETLLWANDHLGLDASVVVLTRDGRAFARKVPHLASHPALTLHFGDVCAFEFPNGAFSHVIHAATGAGPSLGSADRLLEFDTIVNGTRRTLEFARRVHAARFLLTSTGAIYGRQPPELANLPEDYAGGPAPANPAMAGAEAKRSAEMLCAVYADSEIQPTIARCFAFVGPYLPLGGKFAVGNFIRDALAGGPICISGDGTPYRSYMYGADLAIWLWTILLRGESLRPYNVGSSVALTIRDLAGAVAQAVNPGAAIDVAQPPIAGLAAERYVPDVRRAAGELGLTSTVDLVDGIRRTAAWHRTGAHSLPTYADELRAM